MPRYRTRAVPVTAYQFDGEYDQARHPGLKPHADTGTCRECGDPNRKHAVLGREKVCPGEWIVTLPSGVVEAYDRTTFDVTFEQV